MITNVSVDEVIRVMNNDKATGKALVYKELEGYNVPVTQEMLYEYYRGLR